MFKSCSESPNYGQLTYGFRFPTYVSFLDARVVIGSLDLWIENARLWNLKKRITTLRFTPTQKKYFDAVHWLSADLESKRFLKFFFFIFLYASFSMKWRHYFRPQYTASDKPTTSTQAQRTIKGSRTPGNEIERVTISQLANVDHDYTFPEDIHHIDYFYQKMVTLKN